MKLQLSHQFMFIVVFIPEGLGSAFAKTINFYHKVYYLLEYNNVQSIENNRCFCFHAGILHGIFNSKD